MEISQHVGDEVWQRNYCLPEWIAHRVDALFHRLKVFTSYNVSKGMVTFIRRDMEIGFDSNLFNEYSEAEIFRVIANRITEILKEKNPNPNAKEKAQETDTSSTS